MATCNYYARDSFGSSGLLLASSLLLHISSRMEGVALSLSFNVLMYYYDYYYWRRWEDNIKMDLQEVGWGAWTGLIWLRIWRVRGLLWIR
jgi:hypothetical protein